MANTKKINLKKESSKNYPTGDVFQTNTTGGELGLTPQNIILVYYICIGGLARAEAEKIVTDFINSYKIDNVHIHQIFMTVHNSNDVRVECIYK